VTEGVSILKDFFEGYLKKIIGEADLNNRWKKEN